MTPNPYESPKCVEDAKDIARSCHNTLFWCILLLAIPVWPLAFPVFVGLIIWSDPGPSVRDAALGFAVSCLFAWCAMFIAVLQWLYLLQ